MISIVTITYNNLHGLQKTADSVFAQSDKNYQWIIIDGHSQDGTKEFLSVLKKKNTHLLTISEPDDGIYDAMNKGLNLVTRSYVIFMNAGDTFAASDTLQNLLQEIDTHNKPDFIYGPALEERADHDPAQKSPIKIKFLWWGMPSHHQAMVYKTKKINNLKYNTSYKIAADYDFTCRFLTQAKTVHITSFPICLFEAGGISQKQVSLGRYEQYKIRRELGIISSALNKAIYILQSSVMWLRQNNPHIYWYLRQKLAFKK